MANMTYKGCELRESRTTTDVIRVVFGRRCSSVAQVWGITGRYVKPAGMRPFLTSANCCRAWIRQQDELFDALVPGPSR
jgi:hypothetical protein